MVVAEQQPRCLLHADWSVVQTAKIRRRMLVASKAAFLENYLAVCAWILNGSSIEYHEKKKQPFSLSGVRFGSQAILISAWRWSGRKLALHPCLLITCSNSQPKPTKTPFLKVCYSLSPAVSNLAIVVFSICSFHFWHSFSYNP